MIPAPQHSPPHCGAVEKPFPLLAHSLFAPVIALPLLLSLSAVAAIAATTSAVEPQFGRHVVPILSKLGCNGGTCHGAVQGKGRFTLSLFGGDPQADYAQVVHAFAGRRINPIEPAKSLLLSKPTQDISNESGLRLEPGRFKRNADLLKALDRRLRTQDQLDPVIAGLDKHQQTAFDMLRSPRLREALDLSKETEATLQRYTANDPAKIDYTNDGNSKHFLMARRLIEAGVPVVHFSYGYWDWHGKNFSTGRRMIPKFDAAFSSMLEDLDQRGLLDTTIVLALGEMGRKPKFDNGTDPGRDHWDYAQFALAAGGGFRGGTVVGETDKLGEQVTDKFYKVESFGATLYHLMGIDPETRLSTLNNRPVSLIAEPAPIIKEALA